MDRRSPDCGRGNDARGHHSGGDMKTPASPPYLLPSDGAVAVEGWQLTDGTAVGDRLEHWDPASDLELVQIVRVDVDEIRSSCKLGDDSALAVVTSSVSSRTRLAGRG